MGFGADFCFNWYKIVNMKNKKLLTLILILSSLTAISGCSRIKDKLTQAMWERSGISEDVSYREYQQMVSEDVLDEEGLYHSDEVEQIISESNPIREGTVHVSFARNDYLQAEYFRDAELQEKIEGSGCWLNPGDTLYASQVRSVNPNSPLYQFSEFRIFEIDAAGAVQSLALQKENPGEVFRIPEDFSGTEISVVPLGVYLDREVRMHAVYINSEGKEVSLERGGWDIDGKKFGNGTVRLNPMETYHIRYDYSPYRDDWYFDKSFPEPYWDRGSDATVTFLAEPSAQTALDFKVILHPYGAMTIYNSFSFQNVVDSLFDGAANMFGNRNLIEMKNLISLLQINGVSYINGFDDNEIRLSELKAGDEILIRVPTDMKLIAEGLQLPKGELTDEFRSYRFQIPESESMQFALSVSRANSDPDEVFHEITIPHGTFSVSDLSGIQYTEGSELPAENERVNVNITPDTDYCVYGSSVKKNQYQAQMKYADLVSNLESILRDHPVKPGIIVTLDTTDDIGECAFWTGNERLEGQVVLREGQDLQFDYILNQDAGYEIILTAEDRENIVNVWNPLSASRTLFVDESLQGKTLRCRDFLTLREGVVNYDIPDLN